MPSAALARGVRPAPAAALLAVLVAACLASPAVPAAAQDAPTDAKVREGYVVYEDQVTSERILYYYVVRPDTMVYVRQGMTADGPAVLLHPVIMDVLQERVATLTGRVPSEPNFALSYQDRILSMNLQQRVNLLLVGGMLLLLLVLTVLLVWARRRLARAQRQRAEAQESKQWLAEGREEERRRLAQELHDGPVQDLHALRMRLSLLSADVDDDADRLDGELVEVIRELRAISEDLRPPALEPFGLAAALSSHVERFEERHPATRVEATLPSEEVSLPESTRLAVFRIAQEALNNAAQHGEASTVHVVLQYLDGRLRLEVRDDGRGFDLPQSWMTLARQGHFGLLGIAERAEALAGHLHVASTPGHGTLVRVEAPLHRAPVAG